MGKGTEGLQQMPETVDVGNKGNAFLTEIRLLVNPHTTRERNENNEIAV